MKFFYQFKNLIGTVYKKGDILFTTDGNTVISPVGNKITLFDLKSNKSLTLPIESKFNYSTIALSPNGQILIAVNEVNEAHLISMISMTVVHRYNFKQNVTCVKFSPDGRYLAVGRGTDVVVFNSPGLHMGEFNPFVMKRVFQGPYDDISYLAWTDDSRIIAAGSKDGSVRIFALPFLKHFRVCSLGSYSNPIIAAFFETNSLDVTTISNSGNLCIWEANLELNELIFQNHIDTSSKGLSKKSVIEENENIEESRGEVNNEVENETLNSQCDDDKTLNYKLLSKHFLGENDCHEITSAAYDKKSHILVTGYSNGTFILHELPNISFIHSLKVIDSAISKICLNNSGDWIALASEDHGQLIVWEWQSETYIMKQQGHSAAVSTLAYSPDGLYIVTGGEDGKVKLWNTSTGFCFVTFNNHTSAVSCVKFSNSGKVILSASLDGTIKAYDMVRYRNFRTLTSTKLVQFISLAIDSSGEFVAAGGQDVFEIHLWSLKLGRLLEILSGHEGPVVSLAFNPNLTSTELVSLSWDKTLRIWNAVETGTTNELVQLLVPGLCVAYRPDGKEIVVSTLDGQLQFFDPKLSKQVGSIQGRNDLGSGKSENDLITAKTALKSKAFTSVCYCIDGNYVIAGGQSKNVCIYSTVNYLLVKKFEITQNRSLDAVDDFVHKKNITDFGNIKLIEDREEGTAAMKLPGVRKGDLAVRKTKPQVRVLSLQFSPNNTEWAACTTEGILIYSIDNNRIFNPFNLEENVTPDNILSLLEAENYSESLVKSLMLNESYLIKKVLEQIPPDHIPLCASTLSNVYSEKLLMFLSTEVESSQHIEFYLIWLRAILKAENSTSSVLICLKKNLSKAYQDFSKICEFNKYSIQYLKRLGMVSKQKMDDLEE